MFRFFLSFALLLPLFSLPAHAKTISRGCSGKIEVKFPWNDRVKIAELAGRSSCKSTKPNECRLKAYEVMGQCAQALWEDRWSHQIPANCRVWPSGERTQGGIRWSQVLSNLPHGSNSLKDRIEYNTCCRSGTYGKSYKVDVIYTNSGDHGCTGNVSYRFDTSGNNVMSRGYGADCTALIDAGLCGPGFKPSKPSQGNNSKPGN